MTTFFLNETALAIKLLFFVWAGDIETGYEKIPVYMTNDSESDCDYAGGVHGCVQEVGIVVEDPYRHDNRGCNVLTHEYLHVMGYKEHELPYCPDKQEFRTNEPRGLSDEGFKFLG